MEKRSNQSESLEGRLTDADYSRAILKSRGKLNRQQHLHRRRTKTSLQNFAQFCGCFHKS